MIEAAAVALRRPARRVSTALLLLGLVLAGCSDSTGPQVEEILDLIGTYVLETVEGAPLPGLVHEDATRTVHITEGLLYLNPDFRFQQDYHVEQRQGEQQSDRNVGFSGVFARDGAEITLLHSQGVREMAHVEGDLLTLTTIDGLVFVFRKADV